jgi:hypothetical protein
MRWTLPAVFALFISGFCYAQPSLEFGRQAPVIDRDTIHIGDTFKVSYWLINRNPDSTTLYTDSVKTYIKTNKSAPGDSLRTLDPQSAFIPINDSQKITAPFIATTQYFKEGEPAIVVVWPTGTGTENVTKKTVPKTPYVQPAIIIESNGILSHVRIYPTPVQQNLKLEISGPLILSGLYLTDMQGRNLPQPPLINEYLDLSGLNSGMFILRLSFRDGSVATFRIVKQ